MGLRAGKHRAFRSMDFGPMWSKSCSTSKSSNDRCSGSSPSSSVLKGGMSHCPFPRS